MATHYLFYYFAHEGEGKVTLNFLQTALTKLMRAQMVIYQGSACYRRQFSLGIISQPRHLSKCFWRFNHVFCLVFASRR